MKPFARFLPIALVAAAAIVMPTGAGAGMNAEASKTTLRKPAHDERRALTHKYRQRHRETKKRTKLVGICVGRARPRYVAIYVDWTKPRSGVEGTVFKRTGGRWRHVTGGSSWSGSKPVKALLKGFRAPCGRYLWE